MPRRLRFNWPLWIGTGVLLLLLAGYVAWPLLMRPPVSDPLAMPVAEQIRQRGTAAIASMWFFVLGASMGSFLNVVAYRLPLGLTIVSAPSRCPYCLQRIQFQHNIPILGWLKLRGRCRACRLPISPRYVLVELLVGLIYLSLFFAELASGGRSLPIRPPNRLPGVMWNVITPQFDLLGLYAYHCCMLSVLVVCALLAVDRVRIPKRLIVFSCLVGIGCPLVWPQLSVVPWHATASLSSDTWNRLATPLVGLSFGACLGYLVEIVVATKTGDMSRVSGDVAKTLAIIGVFVGWQAVVLSMLMATIIHSALAWWRRGETLWAFWILLGATLTLCKWRSISGVRCLPGAESGLAVHVYWVVSMLVVMFVTREFGPSRGEMHAVRNRVATR